MATCRRTLLLLAAVTGLLCVGVAAAGTVRPGIALDHRIGPVTIGEPKAQVRKALGPGVTVRLNGHRFRYYRKAGLYVVFSPGPPKGVRQIVFFVVTRSARYKTRSGVGVGSSLRQLRRHVRVRCYGYPVPRQCQHEPANVNRPFTGFQIDPTTKRVIEVLIVPGGD